MMAGLLFSLFAFSDHEIQVSSPPIFNPGLEEFGTAGRPITAWITALVNSLALPLKFTALYGTAKRPSKIHTFIPKCHRGKGH